jgi:hypothetical protein
MRVRLARLTNRFVWRRPAGSARKRHGFSCAERSSMLDLYAAARSTRSPERRARYLRHALDESRHATMFAARARELGAEAGLSSLPPPLGDPSALFERLGEVGFLAFVHLGERRGRRQFETYREHFREVGQDRMRALFDTILEDERRHEAYSRQLLVELAGGEAGARRALVRARAWEVWRGWRSAGRFVAERLFSALMLILFCALAPLGLLLRVAAPARSGWLPPPE